MLLRSARSLGLGVPSLRDPSGGIASGLLRCTSSRCVRLRRTVATLPPRINPSTQPSDVARESRSRAAAELTLILLSGWERKRYAFCSCSSVGASLLVMAAWQPTKLPQMHTVPCGSWPASDGGLAADQLFPDEPHTLVGVSLLRAAFRRWRPGSRKISSEVPSPTLEEALSGGCIAAKSDHRCGCGCGF